MKNIYLKITDLKKDHGKVVLATVISTRGSTPQKAGSSALFSKNGLVFGTIGGGLLEGKVQKIAMDAAITGVSSIRHFELDKDISSKDEAICGGQATVLIDSGADNQTKVFETAAGIISTRKPCILLTICKILSDESCNTDRMILSGSNPGNYPDNLDAEIRSEASRLLSSGWGESGFAKIDYNGKEKAWNGFVLLETLYPPLHLVIAGAGHIGKSLCHLGKMLDFEVTVIDDRSEFANRENIPDADNIVVENVGTAISSIAKERDTYIVIVTRGHYDDAIALKSCIVSRAAYIGMIGSKTKIEKMRRNFINSGYATEQQWSEIHAPIGIAINSKTVEEIAVSIAAELVMVRNKKID